MNKLELNKKAKEYVSWHRVDVSQKEEGKHPVFDSEFAQKYNEAIERAFLSGYTEGVKSEHGGVNQSPTNLGGSFLSPERVKEVEFNNIIDKNLEISRSLVMAKKDIKIDKIITLVMFWVYVLLTLVVLIAWNMMGQ